MDTFSLLIRCVCCAKGYRSRRTGTRGPWKQFALPSADRVAFVAYLCDLCSVNFASDREAIDFIFATIEQKRRPTG
jgi:hypothetical protein